jgi:phospholipid-binding lipoprotein MlaA
MGFSRSPNKPTVIALVAVLLAVHPAGAFAATTDDPFEHANRGMYAFHRLLDGAIFGPAARAYKAVLPAAVRKGIRNVITNLKEPMIAANDLAQAHPTRTVHTVARFAINSTIGVLGIFDFAHDMGFPHHNNGFGATAGRYGIQPGPYLFIPLIGPTNFRDLLGYVADAVTNPLGFEPLKDGQVIYGRAIVDGIDQRAEADGQLRAIDDMSTDPYASLRSLFEQNRAAEISEAVTGKPGTAEPQLDDFNDPGAAPPAAAPISPPPPGTPPPKTAPSAALDSPDVDALMGDMLAKPLTPLKLTASGDYAPVAPSVEPPVEPSAAG